MSACLYQMSRSWLLTQYYWNLTYLSHINHDMWKEVRKAMLWGKYMTWKICLQWKVWPNCWILRDASRRDCLGSCNRIDCLEFALLRGSSKFSHFMCGLLWAHPQFYCVLGQFERESKIHSRSSVFATVWSHLGTYPWLCKCWYGVTGLS